MPVSHLKLGKQVYDIATIRIINLFATNYILGVSGDLKEYGGSIEKRCADGRRGLGVWKKAL